MSPANLSIKIHILLKKMGSIFIFIFYSFSDYRRLDSFHNYLYLTKDVACFSQMISLLNTVSQNAAIAATLASFSLLG